MLLFTTCVFGKIHLMAKSQKRGGAFEVNQEYLRRVSYRNWLFHKRLNSLRIIFFEFNSEMLSPHRYKKFRQGREFDTLYVRWFN